MLTVVTFKWRPQPGYRSEYGPETVNTLRNMVRRHYPVPHEFVCVTDDPRGIDPDIRIVPLWKDHAQVRNPHNPRGPSCYLRLKVFSKEARQFLGERFVVLDLDSVVTRSLVPLWDRQEDFIIWGDTARGTPYNGSMFMMTAGARSQVWDRFNPSTSPLEGRRLGYIGSDQAWIGACLGPKEARWTAHDGVYSFRNQIQKVNGQPAGTFTRTIGGRRIQFNRHYRPRGAACLPATEPGALPSNARIVMFHGRYDPWMPSIQQQYPWVKEHYQ